MTTEQRDHYDNLIYLCGDHHTQIDKQEKDFPVNTLLEMKKEHATKFRNATNEAFAEVGFAELGKATDWIIRIQPLQSIQNFTLVAPEEKIRKNDLSDKVRVTIAMGLGIAEEVRSFIESEAKNDSDFPDRLKAGFLEEYYRLRKEGLTGDALFDLMCQFAQRGFREQAKRSAGLAVLIYLFEACEVFEK